MISDQIPPFKYQKIEEKKQHLPKSCLKTRDSVQNIFKKRVTFSNNEPNVLTVSRWIKDANKRNRQDLIEEKLSSIIDKHFIQFKKNLDDQNEIYEGLAINDRLTLLCSQFTSYFQNLPTRKHEQVIALCNLYETFLLHQKKHRHTDSPFLKELHAMALLMYRKLGPTYLRNDIPSFSLDRLIEQLNLYFPKVVEKFECDHLGLVKEESDWADLRGWLSPQEKAHVLLYLFLNDLSKNPEEAKKQAAIKELILYFSIALHVGGSEGSILDNQDTEILNEFQVSLDEKAKKRLLEELNTFID